MKQKILSLLVLLLTAATGAWAGGEIVVTVTAADLQADLSNPFTKNGVTIKCSDRMTGGLAFNELNEMSTTLGYFTKIEITNQFPEGISGINGINGFSVNGSVATWTGKASSVGLGNYSVGPVVQFVFTIEPAGVDVTYNDTKTEASFKMPQYDVTATYTIKRDISVDVTAQVGDGTQEQPRYRVKKDGNNKFIPADMEMAAVPALFTVNDAIEQKALTQTQDYIVQIYAIDAEGQPTGDPMTFATFTFEPGIYAVKAVAADGSDYAGETALSNTFKLYEGFPVVVPATEGEVGETVDLGTVSFYTNEFNLKLDPANQAKLYTLTAIDGSTVTATQVDVVPAGMPFFVLNEEDVDQMVTLIPADDNELPTTSPLVIAEFLGATEDLTFTQADMDGAYNYYVLYKGAFVWVKDPGTLKAGKCYLRVPKNQPTTSRRIVFGDTTAVYDLNDKSEMINDNYYDLNGRKVNAPKKKGVYIQNGRKVVVK